MWSRSAGIRAVVAACAASAALSGCGERAPEPAPPPPAPEAPAPPSAAPAPRGAEPAPHAALLAPPVAEPAPPAPAPEPEIHEAAPPAAPQLSLEELGDRIKATPAIGVFTKLALKNDIDDLVDALRTYPARKRGDVDALHERYEALVLKLMTLLEDAEPELALALGRSRDRIWSKLVDPVEFAKLTT